MIVGSHSEHFKIYEMEDLNNTKNTLGVISRKGANRTSPLDENPGSAYVNCLRDDDVGVANCMLTYYSWR